MPASKPPKATQSKSDTNDRVADIARGRRRLAYGANDEAKFRPLENPGQDREQRHSGINEDVLSKQNRPNDRYMGKAKDIQLRERRDWNAPRRTFSPPRGNKNTTSPLKTPPRTIASAK